ncbi:hypothetical protein A33K_14584 [Burkholderia humptydooensis MSMB43]|uniref:Uncharacterized protein n=1 Tax=Burkholderia humptydooensis MSMB43 TaxID=441157 RepID=A0ABN0G8J7_9BURK|nr:hypothetical protein A33K_14584 [Burkholderia humptydooensis MSMB43]
MRSSSLFSCAYRLCVGEAAAVNPLIAPGQSRLDGAAMNILSGMPLGFQLTGQRSAARRARACRRSGQARAFHSIHLFE